MAKTGGAVQKLRDKSNHKATALRMGTHKPIIARTTTPYNDKAVAFAAHKRAIHGLELHGVVVDHGGRNPTAAECFFGDGLPDEVIPGSKNRRDVKPKKTMAERAAADKRNGLKMEWCDGFKPRHDAWRADDVVAAALRALRS